MENRNTDNTGGMDANACPSVQAGIFFLLRKKTRDERTLDVGGSWLGNPNSVQQNMSVIIRLIHESVFQKNFHF